MPDFPDLYLMRHGQTVWNAQERMQGLLDSPLTELGRRQARRQADLVREIEARVPGLGRYASSLGRAQQTAEIAFSGGDFDSDPRLVEIDIGEFSGARMKDLLRSHAELFTGNRLDWYDRVPTGENFAGLEARVRSFLDDLRGPALIVTHGITLRMFRVIAMGLPVSAIAQMPVRQGAVHLVRDGRHSVLH